MRNEEQCWREVDRLQNNVVLLTMLLIAAVAAFCYVQWSHDRSHDKWVENNKLPICMPNEALYPVGTNVPQDYQCVEVIR